MTSSCLCKNLEGAGFQFQIKTIEAGIDNSVNALYVYKADLCRVRRRTSTKHRSIILVVRSCFHRCLGKLKNDKRLGGSCSNCLTIVGYSACHRSFSSENLSGRTSAEVFLASALGNANDVLGWNGATFAGPLGRCDKVANSFDQFICCVRSD